MKGLKINSPYPHYRSDFPLNEGDWGGASNNNMNENIRSLPEKFLKKIFLSRTLKTYEKLGKPFWVIINDNMLKFHDKDVREKVRDEIIRFAKN